LEGLIPEQDRASDAAGHAELPSGADNDGSMDGRGGWLVLDAVSEGYHQDSPLSPQEAARCLSAVAKLHAAAWEDPEILGPADEQLSLGSYHLKMRNPKELQNMEQSWEHFVTQFQDQAPELFKKDIVRNLGSRMKEMAEYISDQLTPSPIDPYATLVHGDYKAMNVFLPKDPSEEAVMIDFASTGVGLAMSDVAMHT
jgi:Ser/Thr protein kinase RdoA (MazF antagonist)